jgi:hypothetical protein
LLQRLSALLLFPLVVDDEEDGEPDEQGPEDYHDGDDPHQRSEVSLLIGSSMDQWINEPISKSKRGNTTSYDTR